MKRSVSYPTNLLLAKVGRNGRLEDSSAFTTTSKKKPSSLKAVQRIFAMLVVVTLASLVGWHLHGRWVRRNADADHRGCPPPMYGINSSPRLEAARNGTRIVICTGAYANVVDGVSRTLNRLVKDLNDQSDGDNYKVLVLAPVRDPPALEHFGAQLPLPSMKLPFRGEYSFSYALSDCISQRLTEFQPDIMHIATPDIVATQVQQWAIDRNIPVVCSYHTRFTSYLPYYFKGVTLDAIDSTIWWWLRKFHQRCDHIYPPTLGVVDELVNQGFPREAMRLWPRGVNLTRYSPDHRSVALRRSWNITDENTVALLMVTRMVWEKNLEKFISACTALIEGGAPVRCVLVGDGPALPSVRESLPSAIFMGSLQKRELSAAYASADIFFFPSITETWGSVTLEAMASGLAVVVASGPGGSELVEDGVTGLRVNTSHFGATVTSLSMLVHDRDLRLRLSHAGRAKVMNATEWSWDHAMGMLKVHYQEIVDHKEQLAQAHANGSTHRPRGPRGRRIWPPQGFQ